MAGEFSPKTVSVVTPGPDSCRGRRTLSGTLPPDARVLHTTGAAASPVRASSGSAAHQVSPFSSQLLTKKPTTNQSTTLSRSQLNSSSGLQQPLSPFSSQLLTKKLTTTTQGKTNQPLLEAALSAFCSAGLGPFAPPRFQPRLPSSFTQKLLEGGVPSRSPSTPPRSGDGGVSFGSEPGKSFPQKEAPPSHELDL